jgi:hypothetical protein
MSVSHGPPRVVSYQPSSSKAWRCTTAAGWRTKEELHRTWHRASSGSRSRSCRNRCLRPTTPCTSTIAHRTASAAHQGECDGSSRGSPDRRPATSSRRRGAAGSIRRSPAPWRGRCFRAGSAPACWRHTGTRLAQPASNRGTTSALESSADPSDAPSLCAAMLKLVSSSPPGSPNE